MRPGRSTSPKGFIWRPWLIFDEAEDGKIAVTPVAHFVGGIPLDDAENVFRRLGSEMGLTFGAFPTAKPAAGACGSAS